MFNVHFFSAHFPLSPDVKISLRLWGVPVLFGFYHRHRCLNRLTELMSMSSSLAMWFLATLPFIALSAVETMSTGRVSQSVRPSTSIPMLAWHRYVSYFNTGLCHGDCPRQIPRYPSTVRPLSARLPIRQPAARKSFARY